MLKLKNLETRLQAAIKQFWKIRGSQRKKQGKKTGRKDSGSRADVTGGKHVDGFIELVYGLLVENGIPEASIFCRSKMELPGYFRPEKKWDLLIVLNEKLVAAIEFKSQVGPSFGNNYNNRTEEAIGNAVDIKTAYREGAFAPSPNPWVGFLMVLEEADGSMKQVSVNEAHFKVFSEFKIASYAKRYEETLTRMTREGLYDGACLLLTARQSKSPGFSEPGVELSFRRFMSSLLGHATAVLQENEM